MLFNKLKVFKSHGSQYIPDLKAVELPAIFRGRPELSECDAQTAEELASMCPTGAITAAPFTLDMGRCLFCGECARRAPQAVRFTNDYRIGATRREDLVVTTSTRSIPFTREAVRKEIPAMFAHALKLRQVSAGGDASVEMELNATGNVNFDFGRYGVEFVASPRHADGVVVTGPVSRNMAEVLQVCYDAVPDPKVLIVAGSEAVSGGLYAESTEVDRSFYENHTPDLWLPGAPTHPMIFIEAVMNLIGRDRREDHTQK
ncbi:MAG: NADH:ubiquinone oxidoreductase [Rikenellaceae bacterium]|nr:NADH:ubiquinone oxidoreductase [Rikenellaceae bacterium]